MRLIYDNYGKHENTGKSQEALAGRKSQETVAKFYQ